MRYSIKPSCWWWELTVSIGKKIYFFLPAMRTWGMTSITTSSYKESCFSKLPLPSFDLFVVVARNVYCVDLLSHHLSYTVSNHFYLVHLAFRGNLSSIKIPICSIQWPYRWQDSVPKKKMIRHQTSCYRRSYAYSL